MLTADAFKNSSPWAWVRNWVKGFNHFHIFSVFFFVFVEIKQGEFMSSSLCARAFLLVWWNLFQDISIVMYHNLSNSQSYCVLLPLSAVCSICMRVDFCMSAKCYAHMIYRHTPELELASLSPIVGKFEFTFDFNLWFRLLCVPARTYRRSGSGKSNSKFLWNSDNNHPALLLQVWAEIYGSFEVVSRPCCRLVLWLRRRRRVNERHFYGIEQWRENSPTKISST